VTTPSRPHWSATVRAIKHPSEWNGGTGGETLDKRADQRFDPLIRHDRHPLPIASTSSAKQRNALCVRAVWEGDPDLVEIVLR
jgi:hypothetical protein